MKEVFMGRKYDERQCEEINLQMKLYGRATRLLKTKLD